MRRLILIVGLALVGLSGGPAHADAGEAYCEGYCTGASVFCYGSIGLIFGRDKCDAFYEGCIEGCHAALQEDK